MNSQLEQFRFSKEKQLVDLYGSAVIGATGAVGTVKGGGIKSVTRTATGEYDIELSEPLYRLIAVAVGFVASAGSGIAVVEVKHDPATLQSDFKSTNKVHVVCLDFDGSAADPASGSVMSFHICGRNTVVGPYDN